MHLMYAFLSEKASKPNMFCGSCVMMLDVDLGRRRRPHIDLCRRMSILSSLLIVGISPIFFKN
jgi:hypothetical protein